MKTAKALLATIKGHSQKNCPTCGESVQRVALVNLVYTFEPCDCGVAKYRHLIETVFHRDCFIKQNTSPTGVEETP